MKFIAVGVNTEDRMVVVVLDGHVTVQLGESAVRKLADDLLMNANYLWPVEESQGD
jgi:hypothetical protein